MKKTGFTLAEVLITLAIIGVVSAVTLPSLFSNVSNQAYEAGIRKTYNTFSNAIERYMMDHRVSNLRNSDILTNRIDKDKNITVVGIQEFNKQYLKTLAIDSLPTNSTSKSALEIIQGYDKYDINNVVIKGDGRKNASNTPNAAILADGTCVLYSDNKIENQPDIYIELYVDINGSDSPNTYGKDLFAMGISEDGMIKPIPDNGVYQSIAPLIENGWKIDDEALEQLRKNNANKDKDKDKNKESNK